MNITTKIVKGSATNARTRRHFRVRKKVSGTTERPRLVVTRSARHLVAQIVDDSKGHTIASASTMEADLRATSADKTKKLVLSDNLLPIVQKLKELRQLYSIAVVTATPVALLH